MHVSINTSFYLQTSDPFGPILCTLDGILSPEANNNSCYGRAELKSHRCVYASVLNCLILRSMQSLSCNFHVVSRLQLNCDKLEIHVLQRICQIVFLFEFQIGSVISNISFSCNLYFKNILKDANEIYKRLTATGKSVMTLFYHTLSASLYFILFFSVCHNIFCHMNIHYTYSSSLFYYSL